MHVERVVEGRGQKPSIETSREMSWLPALIGLGMTWAGLRVDVCIEGLEQGSTLEDGSRGMGHPIRPPLLCPLDRWLKTRMAKNTFASATNPTRGGTLLR